MAEIRNEAVMLFQMLPELPELIAVKMEQLPALQTFTVDAKSFAAFLMVDVLKAGRRILVDYVFISKALFHEPFKLPVNSSLSDLSSAGSGRSRSGLPSATSGRSRFASTFFQACKMLVYFCGRNMLPFYRLEIFQHFVMLSRIVLILFVHLSSFDHAGRPAEGKHQHLYSHNC